MFFLGLFWVEKNPGFSIAFGEFHLFFIGNNFQLDNKVFFTTHSVVHHFFHNYLLFILLSLIINTNIDNQNYTLY